MYRTLYCRYIAIKFLPLYIQVSANGLVTMGSLPGQTFSNRDFPLSGGSYYALAPFWVDLDPSVTGSISYEIHDCLDRSRDSISLLERVSDFVSEREEVNFQGTRMIVVLWEDIPEYTESGSSSTRVRPVHTSVTVIILITCF